MLIRFETGYGYEPPSSTTIEVEAIPRVGDNVELKMPHRKKEGWTVQSVLHKPLSLAPRITVVLI